ncbi:hypothetical protein PINS_up006663 [Pythium insidiosum]|nr:hypothetical protein PINS_up006663 [Pythium insidiosum]
MVLIHTVDHFNCLRFNEVFYREWTSDDTSAAAMRDRMDQALTRLGWYVAPRNATAIPLHPAECAGRPRQAATGSLHTPSEDSADDAVADHGSDEPLSPISHYALLRALNPHKRRRGPLAILWAQAEKLNYSAYVLWNARQHDPVATDGLRSLETACKSWSHSSPALLDLLRALPYPEVAISLLPEDIVRRLGNELSAAAASVATTVLPALGDSDGQQLWATLVVLMAAATDEQDVSPLIQWLCQHPKEMAEALHSIRLHDWTPIAGLARSCSSLSAPTRLAALATSQARP